jgi:hypothetical protein
MKAASFPARNLPFETECVAFFSDVVQVFGVPKSIGQIYGLLYASPTPLSFSDIVERLDISKGSASQGLQLLRSLGAVNIADLQRDAAGERRKAGSRDGEPVVPGFGLVAGRGGPAVPNSQPNSPGAAPRRVAYEPELRLRKLVSGVLEERIAPLASAGADRLARLRELAAEDGAGSGFYLNRARQLNTWRRRLKTALPMLNLLLGPKSRR